MESMKAHNNMFKLQGIRPSDRLKLEVESKMSISTAKKEFGRTHPH